MNAIKFIKDHGVEKAREVVDGAPDESNFYCHESNIGFIKIRESFFDKADQFHTISISELKRLVESVDQIDAFDYGLAEAKDLFNNMKRSKEKYTLDFEVPAFEQAIADYEAIYSDNNMGDDSHIENHISPLCKMGVK